MKLLVILGLGLWAASAAAQTPTLTNTPNASTPTATATPTANTTLGCQYFVSTPISDAEVERDSSTVFPPNTSTTVTSVSSFEASNSFITQYSFFVGVLWYDTSIIGSKIPVSATLTLYTGTKSGCDDNRSFWFGWYNQTNYPISAADYSLTVPADAMVGTACTTIPRSILGFHPPYTFTLVNVGNISTTKTGIRIIQDSTKPTGDNRIVWEARTSPNVSNAELLSVLACATVLPTITPMIDRSGEAFLEEHR